MRRAVAFVAIGLLAGAGCAPSASSATCDGSAACAPAAWSRLELLAGRPGGSGLVDGVGAAAHFSNPWTFAGDGEGTLWVVDASVIRAVDEASATVTTLAGSFGHIGGSDGVGAAASFFQPGGMTLFAGTLFVCDTENHALRAVDVRSGAVTLFSGAIGVPGSSDGTIADARWREPEGIVSDGAGSLYVADVDNNTIRRIDLLGGSVTTVAGAVAVDGSSDGIGTAATFHKPKQLAIDAAAGRLYIVDSLNASIRALSLADGAVTTLAGFDQSPQGVAVVAGEVWASLADERVARIAADGTVTTVAGAATSAGFSDGSSAEARFRFPAGLWVENGRVLVADDGNFAVRAIARDSDNVTTMLGAISDGSADGTGAAARFAAPQGLAVAGDLAYVADSGNGTIRRVAIASGAVTTVAGASAQPGYADGVGAAARFDTPLAVVLDAGGGLAYVTDSGNRSIRAVDVATGAVSTLPLAGAPGSTFVRFNTPSGLARIGARLYVSDSADHVIVAVDLHTMLVYSVAGMPRVAGSSDGVGAAARFDAPTGLAADASNGAGALFVADTLNDTIRRIELPDAAVTTIAGVAGWQGGDDGPAATAHFARPSALAWDAHDGALFIGDTVNSVVRRLDVAAATVSTPIGSILVSGVALGPLPAQLGLPSAIALTDDGRLLVASESALLLAR